MACFREWPEPLLVYQFQDRLKRELYHNCLPQVVPNDFRAWYQLVTNVDLDLMEY